MCPVGCRRPTVRSSAGCESPPRTQRQSAPAPTCWRSRSRSRPVLAGAAAEVDAALGGTLQGLIDAGEIRGARGQVTVVHAAGRRARPPRRRRRSRQGAERRRRPARRGRGRAGDDRRAGRIGRVRRSTACRSRPSWPPAASSRARCSASYRFDRYRSDPATDRPSRLDAVTLLGGDRRQTHRAERGRDGREPCPRPAEHAVEPPRAAAARRARAGDRGRAPHRLRHGARPRFARAPPHGRVPGRRRRGRHAARPDHPAPPPAAHAAQPAVVLGLVGKGLTFDTGGYSLKPARSMTGMKFDMSGAAAVLEATAAIAELELPIEVVTVVGAVREPVSATGMRPDDVVARRERQDDRDHQHRRRGPARAGRLPAPRPHAGRDPRRRPGHAHRRRSSSRWATCTPACSGATRSSWSGSAPRGELGRRARVADAAARHLQALLRSDVADMMNASTAGKGGACFAARFLQEFAGEGAVGAPRHRRRRRPRPRPRRRARQGRHRLRRAAPGRARRGRCAELRPLRRAPPVPRHGREFAEGEIGPLAEELDREGRFPLDLVAGGRRARAHGHPHPGRVGAAPGPTRWPMRSRSRSSPASTSRSRSRSPRTRRSARMPINLFGTRRAARPAGCPQLASGERLAAFGLTEPGAGSDAGATRTTARLEGGEWVVDGVEDVHHERRHRDLGPRDRSPPARAPTRSRTS